MRLAPAVESGGWLNGLTNAMTVGFGRYLGAGLLLAGAMLQLYARDASAAEVCRFTGTTDPAGRVVVTTDVAAADGVTRVDVAATFESTAMFWLHIEYLVEELST